MELLEAGIKLKQGQHEVLFFTTKPHRSHTDMICIHTPSLLGVKLPLCQDESGGMELYAMVTNTPLQK